MYVGTQRPASVVVHRFCMACQICAVVIGISVNFPSRRSFHYIVIGLTEETVFSEREFVAWNELSAARHASETVYVKYFVPSSHYEVAFAESHVTLGTFGPK